MKSLIAFLSLLTLPLCAVEKSPFVLVTNGVP